MFNKYYLELWYFGVFCVYVDGVIFVGGGRSLCVYDFICVR